MGTVALSLGGREHQVGCREGDEPRVARLGAMLAERWPQAARAAGGAGSERAMLLVALMLADDLDEARARPSEESTIDDGMLLQLTERLERLADTLEQLPPSD